jgi:hypothetical protein
MEDLFFFTKSDISYKDLEEQAENTKYRTELFDESISDSFLRIYIDDRRFWDWGKLEGDHGVTFDPKAEKKISEFQPSSAFIISYHVDTLPNLASFLKSILRRYGGWVGCDDDLETIYTVDDIDGLKC